MYVSVSNKLIYLLTNFFIKQPEPYSTVQEKCRSYCIFKVQCHYWLAKNEDR